MNIIRIMCICALLMNVSPAAAKSPRLMPLRTYLAQPDVGKDPAAMGYAMERCAGLYAVIAKGFDGETAPDRIQLRDKMKNIQTLFTAVSVDLMMKGTSFTLKYATSKTVVLIVDLANLYRKRIERAKDLTNSMFSDKVVADDLRVCKVLAEKIFGKQ